MKKLPLISIYATVYNNANRVRESLNSVISQFPDFSKNFEFVIVDNFSDDGTYEILEEFSKKYKNIRIYRKKCTRGKGRDIALRKAKGKYVFYVDLDSIYYPTLSKLIYGSIKYMKKETDRDIITGLIKRSTLIRLGGWRDLQISEDTELSARLISKGVKFLALPVKIADNEIYNKGGFRAERYAKNTIDKFKLLIKNAEDTIRGNGVNDIRQIHSNISYVDFVFKLIYIKVRLQGKKIYRYSKNLDNVKYIAENTRYISPSVFKISKRYWIKSIYIRNNTTPNYHEAIKTLTRFGFNRIKHVNGFIILYTDRTDKKILNNEVLLCKSLKI